MKTRSSSNRDPSVQYFANMKLSPVYTVKQNAANKSRGVSEPRYDQVHSLFSLFVNVFTMIHCDQLVLVLCRSRTLNVGPTLLALRTEYMIS